MNVPTTGHSPHVQELVALTLREPDGRLLLGVGKDHEDFQTMLSDPDAREHFTAVNAIASAEPHLYRVESVHHS